MNNKVWSPVVTLFFTFCILLVFFSIQLLLAQFLNINPENYSNLGLLSSISSILGILIILIIIRVKTKFSIDYLNWYFEISFKQVIAFILALIAFMIFSEYVSISFPQFFEDDFGPQVYKQANNLPLFYISVVLLVPIFEEMLFRGFLFKGLESYGPITAVFLSSLLFTIVHGQQYKILVLFIILFPMALLLGYARYKSGSLLLPVLLHSLNNLGTCLFLHFELS